MPKKMIITSCPQCNNHTQCRDYTSDSFELCFKWWCIELDKYVRRYVDWNDQCDFIPGDCPLEDN